MAIGYGLGLGLQGTPKDYVELAKNREAAKQKYQAEQQKKKADEVNEVMKNFMGKVGPETVLPVHQRAKDELITNAFKTFEANVGTDTPNMMEIFKTTNETVGKLNDYNEQFKIIRQLEQNPGKSGLFQNDIDIVTSTSDPIELQRRLQEEGSGGLDFDPNTNFFSIKKVGNFRPASTQLNEFVTKNSDFIFYNREQGKPQNFKLNGYNVEYYGMDPGAKEMFLSSSLAGDNYESTRREFRMNELANGRKPPVQGSPEEVEAVKGYVSNLYDQAAVTLLNDQKYREGKGITINNFPAQDQTEPGSPDFTPRQNRIYAENPAYPNGTTYTSLMTYQLPKTTVLRGVPSYARNVETGKLIKNSQGEFSNGAIEGAFLTKKPVTLKSRITGQDIYLEAGTLITDDLMLEAALNDVDFEVATVAFGAFKPTGKQGEFPTYFKSKDTENAVFFRGMPKAQAEAFKESIKTMQRGVEKFKNLPAEKKKEMIEMYGSDVKPMFEKLGESPSNPQSKNPNQGKAPAPAPAKTEPPKNNQSGSKTPTYGDKKTPKIKAGQTYSKDDVDKLSGGEHWSKKFKLVNGQYIAK